MPNLQTYFKRQGRALVLSDSPEEYKTGDIVTWMLPGNLPHIGMVVNERSVQTGNPLIVHNIGRGAEKTDMLFDYKVTGHYRFEPQYLNKTQ